MSPAPSVSTRMRISIITGASSNCFSRAHFLAKALSPQFEVEFVGMTEGGRVWSPFGMDEVPFHSVQVHRLPAFVRSISEARPFLAGDVIYALKPKPSTYGIALLHKWRTGTPVILDMDDWELGLLSGRPNLAINALLTLNRPDAYPYLRLMEKWVDRADGLTIVSDFLERRFGGIRVPHGRDVHWLNPALYDRSALRQEAGLQDRKVILWWGTPAPHKGIDDLIEGIRLLNRTDTVLLVVGANLDHKLSRDLSRRGDGFLRMEGVRPNSDLPRYLSIADLVVIPQKRGPGAEAQIPAKIHEAMAMEKPIVGTAVSDIPRILDGCGLVVEPGHPGELAEAMNRLLEDSTLAVELGRRARLKCIREFSIEAMEVPLQKLFGQFAAARERKR